MSARLKLCRTSMICCALLLAGGLSLPQRAIADNVASVIKTKSHNVTYMAGERESLTSAKIGALEKYNREIVELLPTYVSSVRRLTGNDYTQEVQFLVGSLIDVHDEKYQIDTSSGAMVVHLSASYQYDEKEIERNIEQLKTDQATQNRINNLVIESNHIEGRIAHIRHLYKSNNSETIKETLDSQIVTLNALQSSKTSSLTLIDTSDIKKQVESARKRKEIEEREAAIQKQLEDEARHREKIIASLSKLADSELRVIEAAERYALAHYEYFKSEISAPRTLRLIDTSAKGATFEIVRVDGKSPLTQWQYSGDSGLAKAFDSYPYAQFVDDLCRYEVTDPASNRLTKMRINLRSGAVNKDENETSLLNGGKAKTRGDLRTPFYARNADFYPPASNIEDWMFQRYSLTAAMPFLFYHVDGERRIHHVDYTQGGKYKYGTYDYQITVGQKTITKPYFFHLPSNRWSKSNLNIDKGFNSFWQEYIESRGPYYQTQKDSHVYWSYIKSGKPKEEYVNDRSAHKKHMLDPEMSHKLHCNDEINMTTKTVYLSNEQLELSDKIKIDIVKR
ncbi:hypothetical protein RCJ22_20230 [Vibrio sp. FNV 38]|nr:hypothetical protein [Vibrio sp. FNV 38]